MPSKRSLAEVRISVERHPAEDRITSKARVTKVSRTHESYAAKTRILVKDRPGKVRIASKGRVTKPRNLSEGCAAEIHGSHKSCPAEI